jgi:hypothetical protein
MDSPPLEAYGVEVEIAGTPILLGADLLVGEGELVAVVGPNGACSRCGPGWSAGSGGSSAPSARASWPASAPSCRSGCRCRQG